MSYPPGPAGPSQPDPWADPGASPYGQQPSSGPPSSGGPGYPPPDYQQPGHGQPPGYGPQAGYGPRPGYGQPAGYGAPGPYQPNPQEHQPAMLAHLLTIFLGWIGALVIFLMKKDESPFVRHHAVDALNMSIGVVVVMVAGIVISFVTCGVGAILAVPVMLGWWIASLVFGILAAIAANKGEWYKYPTWLAWPMVK